MPDIIIGDANDDAVLELTSKVSNCEVLDCVVGAGDVVETKTIVYSPYKKIIDNSYASILTAGDEGSVTNNPNKGASGRDKYGPCYSMTAAIWDQLKDSEAQNLASCGNVIARGGHNGTITLSVTLTYKYILEAPTTSCGSIVTLTDTFSDSKAYGSNEYIRSIGQSEKFIRYKEHKCGNLTGRLCGSKGKTVAFSYACPSCCKITARCGYPCSDPTSSVCHPAFSDDLLQGNRLIGGGTYADSKDDPEFGQHITDIRNLVLNSYVDTWKEMYKGLGAWIAGHQPPKKRCCLISKEYTGVSYSIT